MEGAWESRAGGLWVSADPQAGPPREPVCVDAEGLDNRSPLQVCAGVPWQVPPVPPGVAAPGLLGLVCEHVSCFVSHGFLDSRHLVKEPYFSLLIQARALCKMFT